MIDLNNVFWLTKTKRIDTFVYEAKNCFSCLTFTTDLLIYTDKEGGIVLVYSEKKYIFLYSA